MSVSSSKIRGADSAKVLARCRFSYIKNTNQNYSERSPEAFIAAVRRHDINRRVVYMLKVLCAEDSPLCLDGSFTCARSTAMLDGNFVLSKAHAYFKMRDR